MIELTLPSLSCRMYALVIWTVHRPHWIWRRMLLRMQAPVELATLPQCPYQLVAIRTRRMCMAASPVHHLNSSKLASARVRARDAYHHRYRLHRHQAHRIASVAVWNHQAHQLRNRLAAHSLMRRRLNYKWIIGHWCDPATVILRSPRARSHAVATLAAARIALRVRLGICRCGVCHSMHSKWVICPMD